MDVSHHSLASLNEPLDVFGQNPRLSRVYTQLCFCFKIPDSSEQSQSSVLQLLKNGLVQLSASFPWAAGQVVNEEGVFKIISLEETPRLLVKDLRNELPTIDDFTHAGFPFSMLDENVIAPRNTLPERFDEPAPVFLVQANFITGGLLLVFNAQHNCFDMRGQSQIIYLFSKAFRGQQFTNEELLGGNESRRTTAPLLNISPTSERKLAQRPQEPNPVSSSTAEEPLPSSKSTWAYFLFTSSRLTELKSVASTTVPLGYVSTDDVLSAFIWKAVTQARLLNLDLKTDESKFDRLIDVRKYLQISTAFVGNVIQTASTTCNIQELIQEPLGKTASRLRSSLIQTTTMAQQVYIAAIKRGQEAKRVIEDVAKTPRTKLSAMDIKMSSWAKEDCCTFNFGGVLSDLVAVRRPNFEAWEGLAYLLPKSLNGEILAALCLVEDDLQRLQIDMKFRKFGKYIG